MEIDRMRWMDAARGLCIILIIMLHSSSIIQDFGIHVPYMIKEFNNIFLPYRMPVLMFLSGMLLHKSLKKDVVSYSLGKFNQLYWPYVFWNIVAFTVMGALTWKNMLQSVAVSPLSYWYLLYMFIFYMSVVILKNIPELIIIILSLLLANFLLEVRNFSRLFFLFSFFMSGYYLLPLCRKIIGNRFVAAIGIVLTVTGMILVFTGNWQKYAIIYAWMPFAAIAAIISLSDLYKSNFIGNLIEFVGRGSLVFYIIHQISNNISIRVASHIGEDRFYVLFAVLMINGLFFSTVMQLLRERYAPIAVMFDLGKIKDCFVFSRAG